MLNTTQKSVSHLIIALQKAIVNYMQQIDNRYQAGYNIATILANKKLTPHRREAIQFLNARFSVCEATSDLHETLRLAEDVYFYAKVMVTGYWVMGIKRDFFHVETGKSRLRTCLETNLNAFWPGLLLHCELSYLLPIPRKTRQQQQRLGELRHFVTGHYVLKSESLMTRQTMTKALPQTLKTDPSTATQSSVKALQDENAQLWLDKMQLEDTVSEQAELLKQKELLIETLQASAKQVVSAVATLSPSQ